jgi:hypothetical protein
LPNPHESSSKYARGLFIAYVFCNSKQFKDCALALHLGGDRSKLTLRIANGPAALHQSGETAKNSAAIDAELLLAPPRPPGRAAPLWRHPVLAQPLKREACRGGCGGRGGAGRDSRHTPTCEVQHKSLAQPECMRPWEKPARHTCTVPPWVPVTAAPQRCGNRD